MQRRGERNIWIIRITRTVALVAGMAVLGELAVPYAAGPKPSTSQTVRISVFGLFHPKELVLRAAKGSALNVQLDGLTRTLPQALPGDAEIVVTLGSGGQVQGQFGPEREDWRGRSLRARPVAFAGAGDLEKFWLEVPGKLRRQYVGSVEIRARDSSLEAVVQMPLETAVASVVAAESPPGVGIEALKAQAVAARSFLVARQASHEGFDFCDTTHCQFLRSLPLPGSPADEAARATRGLVLTWRDDAAARDRTLAAMYARSCGGRTRTLREAGMPAAGYPYYAVRCVYCSKHPEVWRREVSARPQTERERLDFNRLHGWGAIPGIVSGAGEDSGGMWISGRGAGHGIGLCQLGAADMAKQGASFDAILAHYYPNTWLTALSTP